MHIIAVSKHVKQSPRKLHLIAQGVKRLSLKEAQTRLGYLVKRGARPVLATLNSAVANAKSRFGLGADKLTIKNILVDQGYTLKRYDRSHGYRFNRGYWRKPTAHIKVILEGQDYGKQN